MRNALPEIPGEDDLADPEECQHEWEFVHDWFGDPGIPNGTRDCSYWYCPKCEIEQTKRPDGVVADN